jgi:multiple sugar transport system substrate-binding protein
MGSGGGSYVRTRRQVASALAGLALIPGAAVLAACGAQSGSEPATGTGASKAPAPVLHWFGYAPPHRFGLAQQAVLDDYQAQNPGRVALEVGESGGNVALAKIKTALAAGTQPTMWFGWQVEASDLYGISAVVDLNAELKGNKEWGKNKADLIPALVDGAQWKGHLTLVPMIADPNVLGFNKKLLSAAGVALPRVGYTWDEWLELGRKAASPPDRVLGQFIYNWAALQWWGFSNGQVPLSTDRTKALYDTPQMLATLEWLDQNVTRGILRNGPGDFDTGKTLTEVINPGTITPPRYPNVDPGDGSGVHVTHYPLGPNNTKKEPITAGNVFGLVVLKGANPAAIAAAAEIAAWSVRPDVQLKVAKASSNPPSNLTAAKDPALSKQFNDNPILKSLNEQARYDYPTPNLPSWSKVTALIDETLGRLAKGELRPKDALADIQSKVQPLIDQDLKAG